MDNYNHQEIEKKWQDTWRKSKIFETEDKVEGKENYYLLFEFPYPSGNLHIGHWYAFAMPDIFARMKRMQDFNILFPIGFDAFGLPAENAAIKRGLDPKKWTYENIAYMEQQLSSMGGSFDWSRKVVTADPEYYRWTQWLFLQFFKKGLAYKKKANVNWCPKDQTVLANEQVIAGKCERCGTEVVQKDLEQWFFKITDYADRLVDDLEKLDWPEPIKDAQINWIGKSEGAEIEFKINPTPNPSPWQGERSVRVFTTRADTLFGATYLVLAPEHPVIKNLASSIQNLGAVEKYIEAVKKKTEIERTDAKKEKTGVELKGVKAINPATGEEIPVWVADYVLGGYGTGAVMAVPAHDERDFDFAQKYNLPIKEITPDWGLLEQFGKKVTKYKLRDWLLSRQRYWGVPIPIVYDPQGRPHSVPDEHLPWLLPEDNIDFTPRGASPLASSAELKERVVKIFGEGWTPEYDTMDTFVDSSWYFLRYTDPQNNQVFASQEKMDAWLPVDKYSGGAEHTTMHLLYSRFFHKALFDMGLVKDSEPYLNRMNRGLILGPDGQKMSKSKGNVVDPDEQVTRVGADTVRMYLAFIGPYNETGQYPWDLGGVAGVRRFLERVWRMSLELKAESSESGQLQAPSSKLSALMHKTIKKVAEDIEAFKFNTAISALMILLNELEKQLTDDQPQSTKQTFEVFLKLLAPFAPHLTEEIWHNFGHQDSIHLEKWPKYDETKIVEEKVIISVQVNGKIRAKFEAAHGVSEAEAKNTALAMPEVAKWLAAEEPKRVVFVPNKIISFVV
jgi:leucyl-tRNA synthetase